MRIRQIQTLPFRNSLRELPRTAHVFARSAKCEATLPLSIEPRKHTNRHERDECGLGHRLGESPRRPIHPFQRFNALTLQPTGEAKQFPPKVPPKQFPRATAMATAQLTNPRHGWPWELVRPRRQSNKPKN